jgi:hypothetical protein
VLSSTRLEVVLSRSSRIGLVPRHSGNRLHPRNAAPLDRSRRFTIAAPQRGQRSLLSDGIDSRAKISEAANEISQRIPPVDRARVRQEPESAPFQFVGLPAERRSRPIETGLEGALAQNGDGPWAKLDDLATKLVGSRSVVVELEVSVALSRPFHQVRDPDPEDEQLLGVSGAKLMRGQSALMECRPESVGWIAEVETRGTRVPPWVDADEQQSKSRRDQVGNDRAVGLDELGRGRPRQLKRGLAQLSPRHRAIASRPGRASLSAPYVARSGWDYTMVGRHARRADAIGSILNSIVRSLPTIGS